MKVVGELAGLGWIGLARFLSGTLWLSGGSEGTVIGVLGWGWVIWYGMEWHFGQLDGTDSRRRSVQRFQSTESVCG